MNAKKCVNGGEDIRDNQFLRIEFGLNVILRGSLMVQIGME